MLPGLIPLNTEIRGGYSRSLLLFPSSTLSFPHPLPSPPMSSNNDHVQGPLFGRAVTFTTLSMHQKTVNRKRRGRWLCPQVLPRLQASPHLGRECVILEGKFPACRQSDVEGIPTSTKFPHVPLVSSITSVFRSSHTRVGSSNAHGPSR